jgi:hypothetical protein
MRPPSVATNPPPGPGLGEAALRVRLHRRVHLDGIGGMTAALLGVAMFVPLFVLVVAEPREGLLEVHERPAYRL